MASERPRRAFAGAKMSSLLDKVRTRVAPDTDLAEYPADEYPAK